MLNDGGSAKDYPQVERKRPVNEADLNVNKVLSILEKEFSEFIAMLDPVLTPQTPMVDKTVGVEELKGASKITESLKDYIRRIERITNDIVEIKRRLEI